MSEYLYIFGYEAPVQRLANDKHGWDDEASYAFFIEAETTEQALLWGREVSEEFFRYVYQKSGWDGPLPSWKEDRYGYWIEDDPETIAQARQGGSPRIAVGEIPDFSKCPRIP